MVPESNRQFSNSNTDSVELLLKCINNDEKENILKPTTEKKSSSKKVTIEVDEDDPCLQGKAREKIEEKLPATPGTDPRFQQQNQTVRCYVMYTDFYRCENILGEGHDACTWFKQAFQSLCPNEWVRQWDEIRVTGRLPWHKSRTQGNFPGSKYGEN